MDNLPKNFLKFKEKYGEVIETLQKLGELTSKAGPLTEKDAHLIQMAAAAAVKSEGAVHSHAKRARQAGASADEIHHALVLLVPTIGFPAVAAAFSWVGDVLAD